MARYSSKSWRAFRPGETIAEPPAPPRRAMAAPALRMTSGRCRILGLDPGSQRTGYGVIDCVGGDYVHVAHGCINVAGEELAERLRRIHAGVVDVLRNFVPDEAAIERVFVNRNIDSALKLGQARGAALCALPTGIAVGEYAPREIKLATVGYGAAAKEQVANMVMRLLKLEEVVTGDAADALGVAICHAHARRLAQITATGLAGPLR